MSREEKLRRLLGDLFNAAELRNHLGQPDEGELLKALPGESVSLLQLVDDAVRALKNRGAIDDAFFVALAKARPHRVGDIEHVRELWVTRKGATGAQGAGRYGHRIRVLVSAGVLVLSLGGALAYWGSGEHLATKDIETVLAPQHNVERTEPPATRGRTRRQVRRRRR